MMFSIHSRFACRDNSPIDQQILSSLFIGTSLDSDHIPFYALFGNSEHKIIGDFRYTTYWMKNQIYMGVRTINAFKDCMELYLSPISHIRAGITYYCIKGMIYIIRDDKPVILFSLVVHKDYWRQINRDFTQLDYSKFLILISTEFALPEHISMYKYFKKFILEPLDKPIDLVYTNDITRYSFKPIEIPVQFPTIVAMKDYFSEISNSTLDELANGTNQ